MLVSRSQDFFFSSLQIPFVVNPRTPIAQTLLLHLACPVAETAISPTEANPELLEDEVSAEGRVVLSVAASPPCDTRPVALVVDQTTSLRDMRSEGRLGVLV